MVQIFDSWASVLDEDQFEKWCAQPVSKIVQRVRQEIPDAKIVGFPKGIGAFYLDYQEKTGVDMVGLDGADEDFCPATGSSQAFALYPRR